MNEEARKTVLITGASSGIGRATAIEFARRGWNVAATVRDFASKPDLPACDNLLVTRLDVTDDDSIRSALGESLGRFGDLNVVINNAGIGLSGAFEGFTMEQLRYQFEVNVFGPMAVTKAVLPRFRSRREGMIINIGSGGGHVVLPLGLPYHSSKFALEALSEGLWYELEPLGISVKHAVLGTFNTDTGTSPFVSEADEWPEYRRLAQTVLPFVERSIANAPPAERAAREIYRVAIDPGRRLRYVIGRDARLAMLGRRLVPFRVLAALVQRALRNGMRPWRDVAPGSQARSTST